METLETKTGLTWRCYHWDGCKAYCNGDREGCEDYETERDVMFRMEAEKKAKARARYARNLEKALNSPKLIGIYLLIVQQAMLKNPNYGYEGGKNGRIQES